LNCLLVFYIKCKSVISETVVISTPFSFTGEGFARNLLSYAKKCATKMWIRYVFGTLLANQLNFEMQRVHLSLSLSSAYLKSSLGFIEQDSSPSPNPDVSVLELS